MRAVVVLALAALVTGACGRKAPPIAPEIARPEPPGDLVGASTVDGIRLTWTRPMSYSGGQRMNDLAGFTVERARGDGAEFVRVATVEVTDQERFQKERRLEWTDPDVQPDERYVYRVTAYTLDRYRSEAAGPITVSYRPPPPPPPSSH